MSDARVWMSPERAFACYVGPGRAMRRHSHLALQYVLTYDAPMRVRVSDQATQLVETSFIGPGVVHEGETFGEVVTLWSEPHSPLGRALARAAKAHGEHAPVLELKGSNPPRTRQEVEALVERLCGSAGPDADATPDVSPVVRAAMEHVNAARDRRPVLEEVAREVALSASRLTHIFAREAGIPFRRYVLWVRLLRAIDRIAAGDTATQAAHAAGFSDSAHLSRSFRATFGLSPRALLGTAISSL